MARRKRKVEESGELKPFKTMWLDDVRPPWEHGYVGATWVKTYDEAIELLKTGKVLRASLDHDLAMEHYFPANGEVFREKTGYDVVRWMLDNNCVPPAGVAVHSMNPVGAKRMEDLLRDHGHFIEPKTKESAEAR